MARNRNDRQHYYEDADQRRHPYRHNEYEDQQRGLRYGSDYDEKEDDRYQRQGRGYGDANDYFDNDGESPGSRYDDRGPNYSNRNNDRNDYSSRDYDRNDYSDRNSYSGRNHYSNGNYDRDYSSGNYERNGYSSNYDDRNDPSNRFSNRNRGEGYSGRNRGYREFQPSDNRNERSYESSRSNRRNDY